MDRHAGPRRRILAIFGFVAEWFTEPGFRGCAFINAFGELSSGSGTVRRLALDHKARLRRYLTGLAVAAGATAPRMLAGQPLILVDGAIVSAATGANLHAAAHARAAARPLLAAACPDRTGEPV